MLSHEEQTPPVDKGWVLYWCFYLFGFGALTPFSAIVSSVDYFEDVYPDWNPIRWAAVACFLPTLLTLLTKIWIPSVCRGESYIGNGFFAYTAVLVLIPTCELVLVGSGKGTALSFALFLFYTSIAGVTAAVLEGNTIGVTLVLPEHYPQAYLAGEGCAGLFIALLRVLTKAAFTQSRNGLRNSAFVFFFISAFICLLSVLACYLIVLRHPMMTYYKSLKLSELDEERLIPSSTPEEDMSLSLVKRLKLPVILLALIFSVTLTIFPGITEDVECEELGDWYGVILVVVYSVFDFIGRSTPNSLVCLRRNWVILGTLMRILFLPLSLLVKKQFSNPFSIGTLLAILGTSHGYFSLSAFGLGQGMLVGYKESLTGGVILMLSLFCGLNTGSALSLIWTKLE